MNLPAVIVAGGKGERLGPLTAKTPKALIPVQGRPLLDYSLRLLKRYGIEEVILCTGHLAEQIEAYVGAGDRWGLRVRYSRESSALGTAGCLSNIQPRPKSDFLVLYADLLLDLDLESMAAAHLRSGADATLAVHPNNHPDDSDLVEVDPTGLVRAIHKKPHPPGVWLPNCVNSAIYILKPELLSLLPPDEKADCAHDLFPKALKAGHRLFGYRTAEYLKDVGTPVRLREAEEDVRLGRLAAANRNFARQAVFLDRDGVLNREVHLLHKPEQLELLPGVGPALRQLNRAGWLTIVITNQPVVARGLCKPSTVETIHRKLETLLGAEGAFVDAIYYCPHHPDKGFAGENSAFKVPCDCRKPLTGMIQAAQRDFNIDLRRSLLVGDSSTDIQTGRNAGLKTIMVLTGYGGNDRKFTAVADYVAADLEQATEFVLARGSNAF
jgi:mannose-1-phosphate guanylyltransferase/phosphomannomutase